MADLTQVYAALQAAHDAGDTASATQLANYIQSSTTEPPKQYDATPSGLVPTGSPEAKAGMSPAYQSEWQNYVAGYGRAGNNLAQGLGQAVGLTSREDVATSRRLDAPLLATTGGKIGNIVGTGMDLAPLGMVPGANTLAGSAVLGVGTGALMPSTSTAETQNNAAIGGLAAPASLLAGRALGSLYQLGKGAVTPFFKSGQQGIAANTLTAAAGGPAEAQAAAGNIASAPIGLPGYQPTTAELADNAGLAQFERTLRNNPDYVTQMTARSQANQGALTQAVSGIGGSDAEIAAAESARSAASKPLYDVARSASAPIDNEMTALLQRPSMQAAVSRAQRLAAEQGTSFGMGSTGVPTSLSGSDLQMLKMSLQDMANTGFQQGMGSHEIAALRGTINDLNAWTTANVPALRTADAAFASASKPINQMEVGTALSQKLQPPLSDYGSNRITPNSYAAAMRSGDALAAKATSWKGATLEGTMSDEQLGVLNQVGRHLAQRANADELGRAAGSNTAQNLISQNMLRQMLGPLGFPAHWNEGFAQSSLAQTIARPAQFIGQIGQDRVMGRLANAALNPADAQALLLQGSKTQVPGMFSRNEWALPWGGLTYAAQK